MGCVNPNHLFLGSRKDNAQDMANKMRSTFGSRNARAKLSEDDIFKILEMDKLGLSQWRIAQTFNVHQVTIGRILRGERWSQVTKLKPTL
jgi:hypothetical protein